MHIKSIKSILGQLASFLVRPMQKSGKWRPWPWTSEQRTVVLVTLSLLSFCNKRPDGGYSFVYIQRFYCRRTKQWKPEKMNGNSITCVDWLNTCLAMSSRRDAPVFSSYGEQTGFAWLGGWIWRKLLFLIHRIIDPIAINEFYR